MLSSELYFPSLSDMKLSKVSASFRSRSVMPMKFPACSMALRMISSRCSEANKCWGSTKWGNKKNEEINIAIHTGKSLCAHTHFMATHQSAEASVQDAEAALVIRDLHETLHVPIVVGTHHPVGVRVDLVDATWRHLETHRPPWVAPVVLVAVVTLCDAHVKTFQWGKTA